MDNTQIIRQSLQTGRYDNLQNEAFTTQQINKAAVESGQAMGFTLQVEVDPAAELLDSMEELSMQFEEKSMKSIGERHLGEKRTRSPLLMAVQSWQKILPDLPSSAFLDRLFRLLRNPNASLPNPKQLLEMLHEGSSDPTNEFAMLEILQEAAENESEELKTLLQQTKQQLEENAGPEIRVGLNLAQQINETAKSPEEMQNLRDLYRGEILGFTSPQDCFRSLIANRGAGRLAESLDFLIKGCGIDLQSPSPSQTPEELRRILADLQCVNVLRTVMDKNNVLAEKMLSQFNETCLLNGEKMTERILEFTEMPFVNPSNIESLISLCGISQLLAKIYFCTELIGMFHQLSPRLFSDDADRFKLIDAGQEHLDGLVSEQEEVDAREKKKKEAYS